MFIKEQLPANYCIKFTSTNLQAAESGPPQPQGHAGDALHETEVTKVAQANSTFPGDFSRGSGTATMKSCSTAGIP